jgi:hypothetical protein
LNKRETGGKKIESEFERNLPRRGEGKSVRRRCDVRRLEIGERLNKWGMGVERIERK